MSNAGTGSDTQRLGICSRLWKSVLRLGIEDPNEREEMCRRNGPEMNRRDSIVVFLFFGKMSLEG